MLFKPPRGFIYAAVALVGVAAIGFGTIGVSAATNVSKPESQNHIVAKDSDKVCDDTEKAIKILAQVLEMDDLSPEAGEIIKKYIANIEESIEMEREGNIRQAMELRTRIMSSLKQMSRRAENAGHEKLAKALEKAAGELADCIERPTPKLEPTVTKLPKPTQYKPRPVNQLVYSTNFVCGRINHPNIATVETYQTEINVHNFSGQPVPLTGYASLARPVGQPAGKVTESRSMVIGPYESVQVDCNTLYRLFGTPVHDVCPGKAEAINILERIENALGDTSTSTPVSLRVEEAIEHLHEAVRLEEAGELQEALELEEEIVRELNALIEYFEDNDRPSIADALTDARNMIRRCILSLTDDINAGADIRPQGKAEGFLAIESPKEVEVSAVYTAKTHNVGDAAESHHSISIDVEQIQPHRIQYDRNYDNSGRDRESDEDR